MTDEMVNAARAVVARLNEPLTLPIESAESWANRMAPLLYADACAEDARTVTVSPHYPPCPHARPSWRMCPHCLGVNHPIGAAGPHSTATYASTIADVGVLARRRMAQVVWPQPDREQMISAEARRILREATGR